jgi:phosphatidylinositol-3-phosphatase
MECGVRRDDLPAAIAELIDAATNGALHSRRAANDRMRSGEAGAGDAAPERDSKQVRAVVSQTMLHPAVAAVAVMALLAFGVLIGSAASPTAPSGAATPILLAFTPTAKVLKPSSTSRSPTPPPVVEAAGAGASVATPTTAEPTGTTQTPVPHAHSHREGGSRRGSRATGKGKGALTPSGGTALPPIKHVFLIVLSDQDAEAAFGPGSPAPYLAKTLTSEGELLENYFATSEGELANAIALISGQGPTPQTASDCPQYTDITPGTVGAEGQTLGSGCLYPRETLTLADQLTNAGKTWKAYVEDLESGGAGLPRSCRRPTLGATNSDEAPSADDTYVPWRNPFVYFHSLIDGAECSQDDVGLDQLTSDLKSARTTPSLAYVAPDPCNDGSEAACAAGQPLGLQAAEAFLRRVIPVIKASAGYREGGLIAITFDQAPRTGQAADSSGCCITTTYPNLPATTSSPTNVSPPTKVPSPTTVSPPTTTPAETTATPPTPPASGAGAATPATTPSGGGRVGLLLISKYVRPDTLNVTGEYNHFALLRSIENLFHLSPLGYAAAPGLLAFDSSVFNAYK